jgi:hypothetical protein
MNIFVFISKSPSQIQNLYGHGKCLWGADSEAAEKVNLKRLLVAQALLPVLVLLPLLSMHSQEWLRYSTFP